MQQKLDELLWWWPSLFSVHVAVAAVALLVYVLTTHSLRLYRQPSAAIAWIGLMLTVPYLALPIYLMFGLRKHRRARQMPPWPIHDSTRAEDDPWTRLSLGLGLPEPAGYDSLRVDPDGRSARASLLALIDEASVSIDVMTFIFANDDMGRAITEQLLRAIDRSVQVRILVDGVGQLLHAHGQLKVLARRGAKVLIYAPLLGRPVFGPPNLRNHRKLALFDGRRAWLGGRNLASEYFDGPQQWTDLSFTVTGDMAQTLQMLFDYDWTVAGHGHWVAPPVSLPAPPGDAGLVVPSGPEFADDTYHALLVWACHQARDRIAIATPYFVPDLELNAALVCALHRGVRVELIVPRRSNHALADWARDRPVRDVLEAGGKVLLAPTMTHAKLVVIDRNVAFCGSANLDARSLFLNHELMLGFRRKADVEAFSAWFEQLAAVCEPTRPKPLTLAQDLKEGLAQWLTFQM